MWKKFSIINRDNLRFVTLGCCLIFGLGSNIISKLPPPELGVQPLFWWPNSHVMIWILLPVTLLGLYLIARLSNIANNIPNLPFWVAITNVILTVVALWAAANFCRVAVFADRIESRSMTLKGVEYNTYRFADVKSINFDCFKKEARGKSYTETPFILQYADSGSINLGQGKIDAQDNGMWIDAIVMTDKLLTAKGIEKSRIRTNDYNGKEFEKCFRILKTERTPEEYAKIERIYQISPRPIKRGKIKKQ